MINWLNQNAGFVMGLLTAVYVIATLAILLTMQRSNRLLVDLEATRSRPHVVFDIEF